MDTMSREARSRLMAKIKRDHTKPEMRLHAMLKGLKVRHKMWPGGVGNPDVLVYPDTAVFMHGCFWHACPRHYREPKSNVKFWRDKIEGNKRRHKAAARALRGLGFSVVVIWEHSLMIKRKAKR